MVKLKVGSPFKRGDDFTLNREEGKGRSGAANLNFVDGFIGGTLHGGRGASFWRGWQQWRGGGDAAAVFTDFDGSRDEDILKAGAQVFGQIRG